MHRWDYKCTYNTTLHCTALHSISLHYTPLHYIQLHYTRLHYTIQTTTTLRSTTTTAPPRYKYNYSCTTPHYIQQLSVRWPLQPWQQLEKAQLQTPSGPSVGSFCHPSITTTNPYRFPLLKLPSSPCAVLLALKYLLPRPGSSGSCSRQPQQLQQRAAAVEGVGVEGLWRGVLDRGILGSTLQQLFNYVARSHVLYIRASHVLPIHYLHDTSKTPHPSHRGGRG